MIRIEDRPPVRIVRMEHGKVQALDIELLGALDAAVGRAEADGVGAVVLTGSGGAFSAGVDLFRLVDGGAAYVDAFLPVLTSALLRLFNLPRLVVAAINGHAIAGGCVVALCADTRVMTDLLSELQLLADDTAVNGKLIFVDTDPLVQAAYAHWLANPGSVPFTNNLLPK